MRTRKNIANQDSFLFYSFFFSAGSHPTLDILQDPDIFLQSQLALFNRYAFALINNFVL